MMSLKRWWSSSCSSSDSHKITSWVGERIFFFSHTQSKFHHKSPPLTIDSLSMIVSLQISRAKFTVSPLQLHWSEEKQKKKVELQSSWGIFDPFHLVLPIDFVERRKERRRKWRRNHADFSWVELMLRRETVSRRALVEMLRRIWKLWQWRSQELFSSRVVCLMTWQYFLCALCCRLCWPLFLAKTSSQRKQQSISPWKEVSDKKSQAKVKIYWIKKSLEEDKFVIWFDQIWVLDDYRRAGGKKRHARQTRKILPK